jgi:hypothetical protein
LISNSREVFLSSRVENVENAFLVIDGNLFAIRIFKRRIVIIYSDMRVEKGEVKDNLGSQQDGSNGWQRPSQRVFTEGKKERRRARTDEFLGDILNCKARLTNTSYADQDKLINIRHFGLITI